MVYKFRVILDAEEDIFRDIAILENDTLEDLHNAIINAFGFDGTEMASYYTCNLDWSWNEEDEIPMFDTGEIPGEMKTMASFSINEIIHEDHPKIVYVYDFFSMWTFFVELAAIEEKDDKETYPALLFSHGQLPDEASSSTVRGDISNEDMFGEFDDELDDEDYDLFDGDDSFEDFGYDDQY